MNLSHYAFVGLIVGVVGCGPIYNTEYQFSPPKSSEGRMCTMQCENNRSQCRQMEQMREDQCNRINDLERQRCADQIYDRKGRDPEWHECGSVTSCSADEERCESMYRSCYQGCGGEVRAETRCVANCEQIPPGAR